MGHRMTSSDDRLGESAVVGRIARTHGLRGQLVVNPETDFPVDRFKVGAVMDACQAGQHDPVTVSSVRFHQGRPILALEGISTIEAAESLIGAELRVPLTALQELPSGMFYHHDLVDCAVQTCDGTPVGSVAAVQGAADGSVLVVRTSTGEILVPLAAEICRRVDPETRTIEIAPPDGLLELNVTKRSRSGR